MSTIEERETLHGGGWHPGATGEWIDISNPADAREIVARVPALTESDAANAVDVAKVGAQRWRGTNAIQRGVILQRAAELLRERCDAIVVDLVRENGKTLAEARGEVAKTADFFDYYAGLARHPFGQLLTDGRPDVTTSIRTEPVGVVVAITPWNDPILTPARKLAPALITGNAVILKPATETPLVAIHLARALVDAGLPVEVLSVVTGPGSRIAAPLLAHPDVAAITFTGSTVVGHALRRAVADRTVRLQTEMGGKNPSVVLADADLDLAATTIANAAFAQAGQRCTATSRVIADRRIERPLIERLADAAAAVRLGPGILETTTMGPVINETQQGRIIEQIRHATSQGARLRVGGAVPNDEALAHGSFVEPTVLSDVSGGLEIWREEVFGPVMVVQAADDFESAVTAANDSAYGLAAALFTDSLALAHRFIDRVVAGQVAVNLPTAGWDVHHPFGGFLESGSPFKEQGLEGLRFYTRIKTAAIRAIGPAS